MYSKYEARPYHEVDGVIISGKHNVSDEQAEGYAVYRNVPHGNVVVQDHIRDFDAEYTGISYAKKQAELFAGAMIYADDSTITRERFSDELDYRDRNGVIGPGSNDGISGAFTCGWDDEFCCNSTEDLYSLFGYYNEIKSIRG